MKKSQIQIGETIAVLFVFFILIVIGFIFYAKVIKGNLVVENDELLQANSIAIAQRAMFLPELQCTEDNIVIDGCIDSMKLNSAAGLMAANQVQYFDMFEYSKMEVSQIYPISFNKQIYYAEPQNSKGKFVTRVPVSLYNSTTKRFGFGILNITTFIR